MVIFLVSLIIIILVVYLIIYLYKRYNFKKLDYYQSRVNKIINTSLDDEMAYISQLNLSGASLNKFEKVDKDYKMLINRKLPEISELLNDSKELNQHYQFGRVKQDLIEANDKLSNSINQFKKISKELKDIRHVTEEQQRAMTSLNSKYKELRKTLLSKSFSFGPSLDSLNINLKSVEKKFDEYNKLMSSGDYIKSARPLAKLQSDTKNIEECINKIPLLYKNLNKIFPEQIRELSVAINQLVNEKYIFREDLKKQIVDIRKLMDNDKLSIKKANLEEAEAYDKQISDAIDRIYDYLTKEYNARCAVDKKYRYYKDFLQHAEKQEHSLLIDLNELSHEYELNNNELQKAHDLQLKIDEIRKEFDNFTQQRSKGVIYSEELERQKNNISYLRDVEKNQQKIGSLIYGLEEEEKKARDSIRNFDMEIRRMKRDIEKLNLPGLPQDYIEYFLNTNDKIKRLSFDLDEDRINIDEIKKNLNNLTSDLNVLKDKTKEIIDCSNLTEEFLQYSNRYRSRYPEIEDAYNKSSSLFKRDYNYVDALDIISNAIEEIEPGTYKKITDSYNLKNKSKHEYLLH